ncbi:21566_t:CDS:1, partial [Racocetra persica]
MDLSQELEALSIATKEEKYDEFLDKLGTLQHVEKEAKFRDLLNKFKQFPTNSGIIKSIHNNENLTQYQKDEFLGTAIMKRIYLFAMSNELTHILFESMKLSNNNTLGSGVDGKQLEHVMCANINAANRFT